MRLLLRRQVFPVLSVGWFLVVTATGCGIQVPSDPGGTYDEVSGGVIRVGFAEEPGLIEQERLQPAGPLADLVIGFSERLNARVEWQKHSEETLIGMLEADEIDLAVGGFTEATPWSERVGVSRGYALSAEPGAASRVFVVRLGENRFLSELETFLDAEVGR